jgi:aryl-alcohol dehydrogenase-like predicted oxidoreductase
VDRLQPIAERVNCTLPQLAIAWLLGRDAVSSVIMGATNAEQIEKNVAATGVELTADDVTQIEEIFPPDLQAAAGQPTAGATPAPPFVSTS